MFPERTKPPLSLLKERMRWQLTFEKLGEKEDFQDIMDGMMRQLLSRDVMYDPMKQITAKFPEWLRLVTDTTLSIALISSIILVLIFRLGIKKTEVFVGGNLAPTLDWLPNAIWYML